jgi:hypothetical protein
MEQTMNDWRLPTIDELKTLVVKYQTPAINARVFPECLPAPFWSGSPYAGNSNYACYVNFHDGGASNGHRGYYYRVRLVRGGQCFDPLWQSLDEFGRWYDCGNGLAFDRETGLQWQRYCVGQTWGSEKPSGDAVQLTWDVACKRFNGQRETKQLGGFVKLPNGSVTNVDEQGFITVTIDMPLSDFIDNEFEGVLDLISEGATGSELLSDISYSVVGHDGDTLKIKVTGSIESIDDAEDVEISELPMQEFEVEVTRVGYGSRTVRLSAKTEEDARDIAGDDAGNHLYLEHASDYLIEVQPVG